MVRYASDGGRFVEVGSWYGRSTAFMAVQIVNSGKKIELIAVDTWKGSEEHRLGGMSEDPNIVVSGDILPIFKRNMLPLEGVYNVKTVQATSVEAAIQCSDRTFDFVFIDAAHDYDNVIADIRAWWPKVKVGGWIGGHDYSADWPGVVRAVSEFFVFPGRGSVELMEGSWLIRKTGV